MKIIVRQNRIVFMLVILCCIGFIGFAVYQSNQKLLGSVQQVRHTEEVISQTGKLLFLSEDVEIASKGFAITNDTSLLEPLYDAETTGAAYLANLRQLTIDNPSQQKRIDSLNFYLQKHLYFSGQVVEIRKTKGLASAITYYSNKPGWQFTKRIRQLVFAIQQHESNLLQQRKEINQRSMSAFNRFSILMFILMAVFTVLLLIITANYLRQNKEKEKRSAELVIADKELQFQSEEKEKRAAELIIANKELLFESEEKEKRAAELTIANIELLFQNKEKEKRAAELTIANKELVFQNEEKEKRATELLIANSELIKVDAQMEFDRNNLTALINNTNDLMWSVDKDFKLITSNQHFNDMQILITGKVIEKGENALAASVSAEQSDHYLMSYKRALAGESFTEIEYTDAPVEFWSEISYYPIRQGNEVIGTACQSHNITEIKKAEQSLKQSEKHFRLLIEKGVDLISLRNIEGGILYVSPSIPILMGYSMEEILQKNIVDLIHPDDVAAFIKQTQLILDIPGKSTFRQQRYLHKNGNWIWVEGTITNMLHEPGVNALVSNFRDISEKKLAEEQREFDKNNFEALINNTSDLMWSVGKNYQLITFNQPMYEAVKFATGKELAKDFNILSAAFSTQQSNRFKTFYDLAFTGKTFTEIEHYNFFDDSWAEISYHPIFNGEEIIGIACYSRDITLRKLAELERIQITNDLTQRNKALEQFTYIVSHNLRSPVANITGIAQSICFMALDVEKEKRLKSHLLTSVNKLDEVIKDINQILQVKHNVAEQKERVSFSSLVADIQLSIENLINKEDIVFIYNFAEADEMQTLKSYLYSIFFNLISNSIKYRQPYIRPVIEITSKKIDNKVVLIFKDNGLGIDLKKSGGQVFGLYKRFHLHIGGKGMGLYMVKAQVEMLGGKISIHSAVNEGTEFRIEFGY